MSQYEPGFDHLLDLDGATGPLCVLVTAPRDPTPVFRDQLNILCSRTDTRVLLIAEDLNLSDMRLSLRAGVCGYLLATIAPAALRQSIALMATGEKVLPTDLVEVLRSGQALRSRPAPLHLSSTDSKIFDSLSKGRTNNGIAEDLGLSSATIKVRMKAIFKKLHVSNRTEAALWILEYYAASAQQDPGAAIATLGRTE